MSEFANNLLDAIVSGDQEQMSASFNDAMNAKIGDSLQAKKIELAQRIYGNTVQSFETDDAQDTDNTETIASEDGSEEV